MFVLPRGEPISSEKWSLSNRVLAYIQTRDLDCRGYKQWQKADRHIRKGERAAYILAPCLVTGKDEETGKETQVLRGFRAVAVFGLDQTNGEPLPEVDYTPAELPPLADVAERLGIDVVYQPLPPGRLGRCEVTGSRIELGAHDPQVFFHELAHAAHARIEGRLKGGQHAGQETVAEFTAAVLMHLYGLGDRTGNCWEYVRGYAADPLQAIVKALHTVEQVLALLLE
jgi:antirestriction protein ArdC